MGRKRKLNLRPRQKQQLRIELKHVVVGTSITAVAFTLVFLYQTLGTAYFNPLKANELDCNESQGDQTTYGNSNWIGYVYDEKDNFAAENYHGYITENEIFDESFCGDTCRFTTNGCDVMTETYSVRFKMTKSFACGVYKVTIGGDDGVRLSIDGGNTYILDKYFLQVYTTYSKKISLEGAYNMVFDYWENRGKNRVSFTYEYVGDRYEGEINGDQSYCKNEAFKPEEIQSISEAIICGSNIAYQWQKSIDNKIFSNIGGATSNSYTPQIGLTQTTYYRRTATNGVDTLVSNTAVISIERPAGDETTYGEEEWIGYVYDKKKNFDTNDYYGYVKETETFNETFGSGKTMYSTNGCTIFTETFSVRYKMKKNFSCGYYNLTIGADDGVRLSIDGGKTFLIDGYKDQGYTLYSGKVALNGVYNLVLEYYENGGGNRVSFDYQLIDTKYSGDIGEDQTFCTAPVDPEILTSIQDALICDFAINYQWQKSIDNINFEDIPMANSSFYDPLSDLSETTYYRRVATGGGIRLISDTVSIIINNVEPEDTEKSSDVWIGYVYDGAKEFSADYLKGVSTEELNFDQNFGGNNVNFQTQGCDIQTETFTIRYKMSKTFENGEYTFTIGADDGVRFSIDGGQSYILDDWTRHGYRTKSLETLPLSGEYDLVLDYFEDGGGNRVSFEVVQNIKYNLLPVEMLYFKAQKSDEGSVILKWESVSEKNNDYYTLERGSDPRSLEAIKDIKGAGNSSIARYYEYTDQTPLPGRSYYRLKQTDFDGTTATFDLVTVDIEQLASEFKIISVTPNPFHDHFRINLLTNTGEVQIQLLNSNGSLVKSKTERTYEGNNALEIYGLENLQKGVYLLQLQQEGAEKQVFKLIKR